MKRCSTSPPRTERLSASIWKVQRGAATHPLLGRSPDLKCRSALSTCTDLLWSYVAVAVSECPASRRLAIRLSPIGQSSSRSSCDARKWMHSSCSTACSHILNPGAPTMTISGDLADYLPDRNALYSRVAASHLLCLSVNVMSSADSIPGATSAHAVTYSPRSRSALCADDSNVSVKCQSARSAKARTQTPVAIRSPFFIPERYSVRVPNRQSQSR